MLTRRIIPCLDVRDGKVVKGVRFRDHVVVGDIVDLALRYRDEGADELVFYDITASPQGRSVDRDWVERVARAIDIPFCVAGGIRDVESARLVLYAGADKISEHLLKTVPGIQSVNHIHVWSLTSGRVLATLQVQPMEGVDVRSVMKQVEAELKTKFKIEHPTIGIDWDGMASCSLEEPNTAALSHAGHSH